MGAHYTLVAGLVRDAEVDGVADEDVADAAAVVRQLLQRLRQCRREFRRLLQECPEP